MSVGWVDFHAIKSAISIERILSHYAIVLEPRGQALVGRCPIHNGIHNDNAFHVSPAKNAWKCFGNCQAGGNQLDLVMRLEGVDLRTAASLVSRWFELDGRIAPDRTGLTTVQSPSKWPPAASRSQESAKPVGECRQTSLQTPERHDADGIRLPPSASNRPLSFTLPLDASHTYLAGRGLTSNTVQTFGLGFCSKGLLQGRLAIPIHNDAGQLVAYAGRAVDPIRASAEGKYKLPPDFRKGQVLFNLHRAERFARTQGLIVVEGFFSVFHLHQAGIYNVVALMGSSMSERQGELLLRSTGGQGRVQLMLDQDEAGRAGTRDIVKRLSLRGNVTTVLYAAKQPDEMDLNELRHLLCFRIRV